MQGRGKIEALTTYNSRAFDNFLNTYKEENPEFFTQDQIEYKSDYFKDFLKEPSKLVLDLATKKATKELKAFPQDPDRQNKKALLHSLRERFQSYPQCYLSGWQRFVLKIERMYQDRHLFNKKISEE